MCFEKENSKRVGVPIDAWLQCQLTILYNFIVENVRIPPDVVGLDAVPAFKEFNFSKSALLLLVSKFCNYHCFNHAKGLFERVFNSNSFVFGPGQYLFTFEIPYVYIGPHRRGHQASLSMYVSQIDFTPDPVTVTLTTVPSPKKRKSGRPKLAKLNLEPCP